MTIDGIRVPFGESVTLLTRTISGQDADNNDVFTETPTLFTNCAVWPRDGNQRVSNELLQAQESITVGLSVLLPPRTAVSAIDRMIVRGQTYDVYGEPNEFRSMLTGFSSGVNVQLTKVTG